MRERLAWLAGQLSSAASRRSGSAAFADTALADAVLSALKADYADCDAPSDDPGDRAAALAQLFGLDALELQLLLVATAADLDANIGLAFGLLGGDPSSSRPTVALALELCGVPTASADGLSRLGPAAPLRSQGLIEVGGDATWLRRTLRAADRVVAHLAGDDTPDPTVAAMQVDAEPFDAPEARLVARALAADAGLVWIRAPLGTAGVAVAAQAYAELGLRCLVVDLRRHAPAETVVDAVRAATREAALTARGLVVSGAEVLASGQAFDVLARCSVPVVAVGTHPWQPAAMRAAPLTVDAPTLAPADRARIWRAALGELTGDEGRAELLSLRLTPEEIAATARYARLLSAARDEPMSIALVRDAARALANTWGPGSGRTAARSHAAVAGFADLVLPEHVVAELHRLVAWAAYRDQVLARGPVHGKGGKGSGITALFTGGPGTGKTLAAHVVAEELNLELFQVDLSAVVDKYIGETEKNLERIFHEAESRSVVLFFDEADALFGSRSEVRDARDRYANQEVSYLLQRMEHFDGITVLATNLRGNLDAAFSRRMQFIVHFPDPDEPTRHLLWKQHLDQAGGTDEADPVDIARLSHSVELTGGDIRNIVLAAAYDATSAGELLGMRHVQAATAREYRKLGRRLPDDGAAG